MITTLCRTPVRASMSASLDGVSVCMSRPALTASPARVPCEVRIKNNMSLSASISLAAACNDVARVSIVCTSAFFRIVLHVDRTAPETVRHDLCCTGRLPSKHALIAEKAEGHHADLASTLNGVHRPGQRDSQNQSDERCREPADPGPGLHREPRFVIAASLLHDPKVQALKSSENRTCLLSPRNTRRGTIPMATSRASGGACGRSSSVTARAAPRLKRALDPRLRGDERRDWPKVQSSQVSAS